MEKMKQLLENVQHRQMDFIQHHHLQDLLLFRVSPKISRGENYKGLPWLILDHPRISIGGGLVFIRTMFWWGQFFSSTLQLSGQFKKQFEKNIMNSYESLSAFYIGLGDDPWAHHFDPTHYRLIGTMTHSEFKDRCLEADHLKIATHIPVQEWEFADELLMKNWEFLVKQSGLIP